MKLWLIALLALMGCGCYNGYPYYNYYPYYGFNSPAYQGFLMRNQMQLMQNQQADDAGLARIQAYQLSHQ